MNTCSNEQVAGVVVLYNPVDGVLDNIRSYLAQVGRLFVVDNSETTGSEVVQQIAALPGVSYHANGRNLGIASALNSGAKLALKERYQFLLTMDQDSRAVPDMVSTLLQSISNSDLARVGIIAPSLVTKPGKKTVNVATCRTLPYVMTSGNLLNLHAYQAVGAFNEDLFIDFVDVEYCLRLNARGFSVVQVLNTHLEHRVGDLVKVTFVHFTFYITSHSPLRMYYKTRNRFLVGHLYRTEFPIFWWQDRLRFLLEICRLLLFEPQKIPKIRMMWRGWRDYKRGQFGKYADSQA